LEEEEGIGFKEGAWLGSDLLSDLKSIKKKMKVKNRKT
jgi:hypothetical protein